MHIDSGSFAFQDGEDVALNGSKKVRDLSNPTRPVHLHLHLQDICFAKNILYILY